MLILCFAPGVVGVVVLILTSISTRRLYSGKRREVQILVEIGALITGLLAAVVVVGMTCAALLVGAGK